MASSRRKLLSNGIDQFGHYEYLHGNSRKVLHDFEDGFFRLTVTSPPYNVGKDYEIKKTIEEYLAQQEAIIEQIIRVTHQEGSICWQVGNYIDKRSKEVFPLDIYYYEIFKKFGLKLRNRIIWHFGHGLHNTKKFSGRYETILWFTKSDNYTFNLDPVRVPQKYPGKKHYKGPYKGKYSGNKKGKNPTNIWEIPNVKASHVEKTIHPCQFPIILIDRLVKSMTNENDWVLDPFAGVGTTIISSIRNGRNSVGIEKYKKYINIGENRIKDLLSGKLKIREESPIYDHTQTKLSQIPEEFNS